MAAMVTLPGPIVSAAWLADQLGHPGLRVADVRWALAGPPGRDRYEEGHVPGDRKPDRKPGGRAWTQMHAADAEPGRVSVDGRLRTA